jgi:phage protein D
MAELQIARPTIVIASETRPALADGLLGLLIAEDTTGLARCETQFGNWGAAGTRADFLHFDRRVLEFGKELAIKIGNDALFSGRITALEGRFPQARPPEIVALAEDRFQDLRKARRTRSFADVSDADVFRKIAQDHGLTADIAVDGPRHRLLAQVNQSDLAFLRERARAIDAELWVEGSTLHATAHTRRRSEPLDLAYGATLREFTVLADLAEQYTTVAVSGWDVAAKREVKHEAGEDAIRSELEGETSGPSILQSAFGKRVQSLAHTVPLDAQAARFEAETFYRLSARRFVVGSGVAETNAKLRVGASVRLSGLGPLFNGRYYLTEVRHLFDGEQGIRTEFTAERPSLGHA